MSRRTFQPLPRPPFESTSWHYKNTVNIWLPSIYQIHLLSRGAKKARSLRNVSCGYFTLLIQHEFAGGLADRCAEETGEEGMILET